MDAATKWVFKHVVNSLFLKGKVNNEKLEKSFIEEENRNAIDEFLKEPDVRLLVIISPVLSAKQIRAQT